MRLNCAGSSLVSAMTQTPASRPCGLETTPPMSFSAILIAATSACCCARAGADTPASNTAGATNIGSLLVIFMSPSLAAPAGSALYQPDLFDLRKVGRSDGAEFTRPFGGVHRARQLRVLSSGCGASASFADILSAGVVRGARGVRARV